MNVLLVGVGLVGSHVALQLIDAGHTVVACDRDPGASKARLRALGCELPVKAVDVSDYVQVAEIVHACMPECIVNTVAVAFEEAHRPAVMVSVNVTGLVHIMEAARLAGTRRVVQTSSTSVYGAARRGTPQRSPISESNLITLSDFFYGATKQAAEVLGHNYARHMGVEFVALRSCHVFGGGSGSVGAAIENLVNAAVESRTAIVDDPWLYWQGREDFNYVKDLARAVVLSCTAGSIERTVMNVSMGAYHTFDEVVQIVRDVLRCDLQIEMRLPREQKFLLAPLDAPYDISLARAQLGFEPRSMRAAIADYAALARSLSAAGQ